MAILEIVTGNSPPRQHELTLRETIVGRHPDSDIVLSETTVSRRHARILREKDGFFVEDLGSQHGTYFNDSPLRSRQRLSDRDQIRVRDTLLTFYEVCGPPVQGVVADVADGDHPSAILASRDASSVVDTHTDVNAQEKLRALLEITRSLGTSLDIRQIFPKILDSVFRIFPQASRGCILLADPADAKLRAQAVKFAGDDTAVAPPISRTIAQRVISQGEAILSTNTGQDQRFQLSESIVNLDIRSVMCAPLIGSAKQPLGMIQIDTKDTLRHFSADDLDVLANVANLAGQLVDHARLHKTQIQFARRERDLEVARQVQLHFLPEDRPTIRDYQVFDFYRAAEGVGGDYFDYIRAPGSRQAFAVGDVAGKGVSAALLMARLCSDVRYCLVTNRNPAAAVRQLNREISKLVVLGGFITFVLCVLDPQTHEVVIVNAGHMPPLWRHAARGAVEPVGHELAGPPLGVDAQFEYQQATIQMEPGDAVFLYTDGVSEATDPRNNLFGNQQIRQVIAKPLSAQATVDAVLERLRSFTQGAPQTDDTCMLCFSRDQT